jgi:thioredoxin-dependent peroxiredoxin
VTNPLMTLRRVTGAAVLAVLTGVGCSYATPAAPPASPVTTDSAAEKPPAVGDEARDFELSALGGDKVKLSKLTDAGPVVLVVLRGYPGYQCPLCTRQFGEFLDKADEFKKVGAQVVFVYPGPAEKLKERAGEFVKGKDYPAHFQFLLDPDYTFTNAYGLRWDAKNETAYPSTFVIDGKRRVTFAKVSKTHGDRSKVTDVIAAIPGR